MSHIEIPHTILPHSPKGESEGGGKKLLGSSSKQSIKLRLSKTLVSALLLSLFQFLPAPEAEAAANNKAVICHRTKSATNPYRKITVGSGSVNGNSGHQNHDGSTSDDVWTTSDTNGGLWGDIIPSSTASKRKNWTTAGQDIFYGRKFVPSTGLPACRTMTLKAYVDAMRAAGVSDANIVADLNDDKADEDKAILNKNGQSSFTTSNLTSLADSSVSIAATTTGASSVTTWGATLNGSFKTDSTSVYWYFEYNQEDPSFLDLPTKTTCTALGTTNATVSKSSAISSLTNNKKHYYRAVIVDSCGTPTIELYGEVYSFTTASVTYRVTYDQNGGSGSVPTDPNTYSAGDTAYIYGNSGGLTKSGGVFKHWSTSSSGSALNAQPLNQPVLLKTSPDFRALKINGSNWSYLRVSPRTTFDYAYGSGDQVTVNSDITLYAIYDPAYTVTYNGSSQDSGAVPTDSTNYANGSTVTVLGNTGTLAKTGYTFGGWCTQAVTAGSSCGGDTKAPGSTITVNAANISLYAIWTASTYTISYNNNGGSGTMTSTTFTFGNSATISNNTFTRTGYTFQNWYTNSSGSGGTSYSQSATYSSAADLPLYAIWTGNKYTYDANTGSGTAPADQTYAGSTINAATNTFTLNSYSFYGWCATALSPGTTSCPTTRYSAGNALPTPTSATVTLYAVWSNATLYQVTYNTQGGSSVGSTSFLNGDTIVLPSAPTQTGYTFNGWFDSSSGGTKVGDPGGSYGPLGAANVTLYAQWTIKSYTLTYDANGNTGGSAPSAVTQNYNTTTSISDRNGLEKTGYTFSGWNSNAGGTGTSYAEGSTYTITDTATIYAQWSADPTYLVTYNDNVSGETISVPSDSNNYLSGAVVTVSTTEPSRSGYTFSGWTLDSGNTGTVYSTGGTSTYTVGSSNITFYAKWTAVSSGGGGGGGSPGPEPIVIPKPVITSLSRSLICTTGFQVNVLGTGLSGGTAKLDGVEVPVVSNNGLTAVVNLPASSAGKKTLEFTTTSGSASIDLTYQKFENPKFADTYVPYLYQGGVFALLYSATDTKSYRLVGNLPEGLSFNPVTGSISGSPLVEGLFSFSMFAVGDCGETEEKITLDIDKAVPKAISHRIYFSRNNSVMPPSVKENLERFLNKVKELSPRYITPQIYITTNTEPNEEESKATQLERDRYQAICEGLIGENIDAEIILDVFSGDDNMIEIIAYWPNPS